MSIRAARLAVAGILLSTLPGTSVAVPPEDLRNLSLEELMEVPVVTASRWEESLGSAPATVLVLTGHELADRGYGDLSEILEDLPGMDPVRPYGATWFKSYWRGFRNDIGSSFLLLLDGMELNHLYFRTAHVLSSIPLGAVERIEVVYGPASSVYGANAFMGVINILTRKAPERGVASRLRLEGGEREIRIGDGWAAGRIGAWSYRLAGRWAEGNLDPDDAEGYPFSEPDLYSDPRLWGGFAADSRFGGRFSSPWRNRGFDLRLERGALELGATFFETSSGYGVEYAADRAQNLAVWRRPDLGIHLRWQTEVGERLWSSTLLRYRESDVDEESFFVEAFEVDVEEGDPRRVDVSVWAAENRSWTLVQDLELRLRDDLDLSLGLEVEEKDLQKAYATAFGPSLPPGEVALATYPFPTPGGQVGPERNRIETRDLGLYVQSRWEIGRGQSVHAGVRWDDNSEYGSEVTYRGGWVGNVGPWVLKALYGEAFQEPNPRVLFGGWKGSGSDPDLRPERSRTIELTAGTARARTRGFASLWRVHNEDLILTRGQVLDLEGEVLDLGGARNAGDQTIEGMDLHGEVLLGPGP
ncbi:MAG: TonB-dependent receptor, partial [Thermoanaerobaculia bacterium]|nr:TonB-dependent receptor [Thermoanaerobaculia bacterium]